MGELRSWLFLGLGLLLATLTGVSLYGVATEYTNKQVAAAEETSTVVVAKADISARVVLTNDLVTTRSYPAALVPRGAVSHEADVLGQTTIAPISAGSAIVRAQLVAGGGKRGISLTLERGKVLAAFPVSDALTTSGLVQSGDHVDILATIQAADGGRRTQTMVQNLEVLDVITPAGAQRAMSLTFAVDHQVALVLKYLRDAQAIIDIVVRSRAESELTTTNSVDASYIQQVTRR